MPPQRASPSPGRCPGTRRGIASPGPPPLAARQPAPGNRDGKSAIAFWLGLARQGSPSLRSSDPLRGRFAPLAGEKAGQKNEGLRGGAYLPGASLFPTIPVRYPSGRGRDPNPLSRQAFLFPFLPPLSPGAGYPAGLHPAIAIPIPHPLP